jgi:hypothetical protein
MSIYNFIKELMLERLHELLFHLGQCCKHSLPKFSNYRIADLIRSAMKLEDLSEEQARSRIWLFDVNGLLENTRKDLIPEQEVFSLLYSMVVTN